jgi:hypothetical protein
LDRIDEHTHWLQGVYHQSVGAGSLSCWPFRLGAPASPPWRPSVYIHSLEGCLWEGYLTRVRVQRPAGTVLGTVRHDLRTMLEYLLLLLSIIRAAVRDREALVAENLLLRHQLGVLPRPTRKRPRLRARDKLVWVVARTVCRDWRRHLVVVRPESVIRWHARPGVCSGAGARGGRSVAHGSVPRCAN